MVLVGSDCASRRRAVSRGSVHSRSEKWVIDGSECRSSLARPSGRRGRPESEASAVPPRLCLPVGGGPESEAGVGPPLTRRSDQRLDHPSGMLLGFWAGPGVVRRSQLHLLGRAFAGKPVHEGPRVYEPDTTISCRDISRPQYIIFWAKINDRVCCAL